MLAILYIIICGFLGATLIKILMPNTRYFFAASAINKNCLTNISDWFFIIPSGLIIGILCASFLNYYVTLILSTFISKINLCKNLGIIITLSIFLIISILGIINIKRKNSPLKKKSQTLHLPNFNFGVFNTVFYSLAIILFIAVATYLFTYTYKMHDNMLCLGSSTMSDLSPHTAMTSSFGNGFNFPTQYMHFSGDKIQYHFLFYSFCGTLQYLGLPISMAINIPSIIGMVCCFILLGVIAFFISGKRLAFIVAPLLVLFRSSLNIFIVIYNQQQRLKTPLLRTVKLVLNSSDNWSDVTPFDKWGIWSINVYPNQRHLLFAIGLILISIMLFIPQIRLMSVSLLECENFFSKIKTFLTTRNAWIPRNNHLLKPWRILILVSLIAVFLPYFHAPCLIALLLIFLGMAIFSEGRLLYLIVAVLSILSSFLQAKLLSNGSEKAFHLTFNPGFIVENPSIKSVLIYLFIISGLTLILATIFIINSTINNVINCRPLYKLCLFIAFLLPLIFAFTFQISTEMLANHKFIQITLILMDIFVATLFSYLVNLPMVPRDKEAKDYPFRKITYIAIQCLALLTAVLLVIPLTATGISEWLVYHRINETYFSINTKSEVTEWVINNTDPQDAFLTAPWGINRFSLSGRPMYYGWPYYAWSAGHDTDKRKEDYSLLISGCNGNIINFTRMCKENNIRYLILDLDTDNLSSEFGAFNTEFFESKLECVASFEEDYNAKIYKIF